MDREILHKFFEGKTNPGEENKIKQWIEISEENKKSFKLERKIFDTIILTATGELLTNKRSNKITNSNLPPFVSNFLKIAAVVVFTFGVSWFYNYSVSFSKYQTVIVPNGQRTNVILPDGTNVWLNSNSTLKYPLAYAKFNREVELNGEAYFDVVKNENKPFKVLTSKGEIEVIGTKFNVIDYSENNIYEAALMEGSIKVCPIGNAENSLILNPGWAAYIFDGQINGPYKIEDYGPYRWKEGLICFKGASFPNIIKEFQKHFGIDINLDNNNYNNLFYTGKFRQEDGVDYALRVLQKDIGFKYHRDDEKKIITIK